MLTGDDIDRLLADTINRGELVFGCVEFLREAGGETLE